MSERRRVKILSANVARKIAAGEVIDRPNAIVRELMDNSIDSGAKKISVEIQSGGIEKIRVVDNGCGMTPEEIHKMKQNIYNHPKESSKSIGLSNIYQRIQLCYGKDYGLQVKSKKNLGTLITVVLPAHEYRGGTEI